MRRLLQLFVAKQAVQAARSRHGLTLLEVLVSVFVLAFALLALVSIVPVAGSSVRRAETADKAQGCGAACLRDLVVRQWLWPATWLRLDTQTGGWVPLATYSGGRLLLPYGYSFAIDPLYVERNLDAPAAAVFPYDVLDVVQTLPLMPQHAAVLPMQRVTLACSELPVPQLPYGKAVQPPWRELMLDRLFLWRDDLAYAPAAAEEFSPRPMMAFWDQSQNTLLVNPWPPLPGESQPTNSLMLGEMSRGRYSWMATVSPRWTPPIEEPPGSGAWWLNVGKGIQVDVSVVVFFTRDFSPPRVATPGDEEPLPERTLIANLVAGGIGGGDVVLSVPQGKPPMCLAGIREDQWIMLSGIDRMRNMAVHKWYRIVAAGEVDMSGPVPQLWVTLSGPDWNTNWCFVNQNGQPIDSDGDGYNTEALAGVFTGVAGVYTRTVELR